MSAVTEVRGVGGTTAERLRLAGIESVAVLAKADAKQVAGKTGVAESIVARLITAAQENLKESESSPGPPERKASARNYHDF